ncbi:MAG: glycerate kinase [[Ruminococcus] gnavus]|nr:glycerate kinase [Mediterraneibacter gnavus]
MKFLFASDSFKGTLSSSRIAELLTTAAKESFPNCICTSVETADGGEGTTDAVLDAVNGQRMFLTVHGPLWKKTDCFYGKLDERRAVMEMAATSGLPLLQEAQRDPRKTTTYGTGEMIQDALDHGFRDISIAIGGSATNDGGMGCMCALGVRFLDQEGRVLTGCGENLGKIARIDLSDLDPRITETKFTVMCDVNNPLCGENGATYTFGGQKGGTPEILEELETGMLHYRELLLETFHVDVNEVPGAGAAGGLGAALVVFLNATLKSGIETVLDLVDFDTRLQGVSLVVTGEGCTDWQSAFGKVLHGVGMRCKKYHIPVVALAGSMGQGAEQIYESGIDSILTTVNAPMELHTALEQAEELYLNAARRLFRMLKVGFQMKETEEQSDQ